MTTMIILKPVLEFQNSAECTPPLPLPSAIYLLLGFAFPPLEVRVEAKERGAEGRQRVSWNEKVIYLLGLDIVSGNR